MLATTTLFIVSCSKNNDELAVPELDSTAQVASKKKSEPFNGVLTMHPDATAQLSCGCQPGYFEIGPFAGNGTLTNFGYTQAITTPCVANIPNGITANTQCVTYIDDKGHELYSIASAPYDNVLDPNTYLIVGTGNFTITGGTGKYHKATGTYTATVINNMMIAAPGTATVTTIITGSIIK